MTSISVIMPSYLGTYPGSRANADQKFIRAVESFRSQTHQQKQLVIVSDGCEITNRIYDSLWKSDPSVSLIRCEKSPEPWPGKLREVGRAFSTGEWITYLDSDDLYLPNYLHRLSQRIDKLGKERVIFNHGFLIPIPDNPTSQYYDFTKMFGVDESNLESSYKKRWNEINLLPLRVDQLLGTYQIIHHREANARWKSTVATGEDKLFIRQLLKEPYVYVNFAGYAIMHNSPNFDG